MVLSRNNLRKSLTKDSFGELSLRPDDWFMKISSVQQDLLPTFYKAFQLANLLQRIDCFTDYYPSMSKLDYLDLANAPSPLLFPFGS